MGAATSPLSIFQQTEKAQSQLAKWSMKVSDDDIVIHVIDQMYNLDWFSKETMTKWEEISNSTLQGRDTTWSMDMHRKELTRSR